MNLQDKKITVMGLGVHGGALGNVKWLCEQGARVTVTDLRGEKEMAESIERLRQYNIGILTPDVKHRVLDELEGEKRVMGIWGGHREEDFVGTDMIVRNPAVARDSKYLQMARSAGVPIEMDSSLFLKYAPNRSRVIGVTGTKGKSTATHVIGELMKLTGESVVVTGIEGTSPLESLDQVDKKTWVVFELSSWRLEALREHRISPGVAVVTSLLRDHLNTYDSFEDYIKAKRAIIDFQEAGDLAVLNGDDKRVREWKKYVKGEVIWYGFDSSTDAASTPSNSPSFEGGDTPAFGLDAEHQRRNIRPGIILVERAGVNTEDIKQAVKKLKGLPHRLELVGEIDGVTYINDSAATMPDATIAALKSFGDKDIVLILGGSDKELEFEELGRAINEAKMKGLIWLPGTATKKMREVIWKVRKDARDISYDVLDMEEAVREAKKQAAPGDVVLLSSGATSFGLFKHEFDRGDKFREAVEEIAD